MEGLACLAAPPIRVTLGGCTHWLRPLTVRDYAEIEHVLAELPGDSAGTPRGVSLETIVQWLQQAAGQSYVLWLAVRRRHAEVTLAECSAWVAGGHAAQRRGLLQCIHQLRGWPSGN